jgi:hypothetical protein
MKIPPAGVALFRMERQTDRSELAVRNCVLLFYLFTPFFFPFFFLFRNNHKPTREVRKRVLTND